MMWLITAQSILAGGRVPPRPRACAIVPDNRVRRDIPALCHGVKVRLYLRALRIPQTEKQAMTSRVSVATFSPFQT
jgi:hypothetical protein